jgi:hypothetical protein
MPLKDPQKRKEYHKEYLRRKYNEDPIYRAKHRARTVKNDKKYRLRAIEVVAEFRKNGCSLCSEKEACCLSSHHLDPSTKEFMIGDMISRRMTPAKISKELEKCICVCENCHRKIHAGKIILPQP